MPFYKMIVSQQEPLHHNGKAYNQGDVLMERVQLSEIEYNFNVKWPNLTGCRFELIKDAKVVAAVESGNLNDLKKEQLAAMCTEKGIDISDLNLKAPNSKAKMIERLG
jgi:hypothetical protein